MKGVDLEAYDISRMCCYVCIDGVSIVFATGDDVKNSVSSSPSPRQWTNLPFMPLFFAMQTLA